MNKKILLVEPDFPIPPKSKSHKNFLPIGLLKIASWLRDKSIEIKLIRAYPREDLFLRRELFEFKPNEVWITSLFTYWSKYVRDVVQYYKTIFPNTKTIVGGIYASLMPRHCKEYTGCDEVHTGVIREAENFFPAYDLLKDVNPHSIDYQIVHASRGCKRKCPFCGTWRIEPKFKPKKSIKNEIKYHKIIFYDNNFLYNPYVQSILEELITLKKEKKISWCESQSGFDGRVLLERPLLARMVKEAGFRYPRIAWDWSYDQAEFIKCQIDLLVHAGYRSKDIYVFMLYNWDISFEEMEKKRIRCWEWKVQIADCRYRPLNQTYDDYNAKVIGQRSQEYHIHEAYGWTDSFVKQFRKNVRRQNICVRQGSAFYSKAFEHKRYKKEIMKKAKTVEKKEEKVRFLESIGADYWFPNTIAYLQNEMNYNETPGSQVRESIRK